jgi:outer membrane protein TolC
MPDRAIRTAAAALVVAFVGACASVQDARRAQDPASAVPGERTPTAAELKLPTKGALRLSDAVDVALRVSPNVLRTRHAEESAEARVGEAEAAFLPELSANASDLYVNRKPGGPIPSGREEHRFKTAGLQVSWLLFDFGRTSAEARAAAANFLAAQADSRGAEIDAVFLARSAYFGLVKQIQLRDVAAEAVRQFEVRLDQVREFVRVGTRIPYDETKAEVDLGNAKLTLVQTEDAVLLAQATLATAMGLAETGDWIPDTEVKLPAGPATFDACWAVARRERPALASAQARVKAASALVDAQVAALYPSSTLGFGISESGSSSPLPWTWQIGPSATWTPFDGFRNLYSIDDAVAALKSARTDYASAEQLAWLDVRTAWLGIEDAVRRLELTALVVKSAEENLRLAQGRFDARVGTSVELTDAQQALTQAKSDDVQARVDHELATARLLRALGAGESARGMEKAQ